MDFHPERATVWPAVISLRQRQAARQQSSRLCTERSLDGIKLKSRSGDKLQAAFGAVVAAALAVLYHEHRLALDEGMS